MIWNLWNLKFGINIKNQIFEVSTWKEGSNEYVNNQINIAGNININNKFDAVRLFDASPNPQIILIFHSSYLKKVK